MSLRPFDGIENHPLTIREVLIEWSVVGLGCKCSILLSHDSKTTLLPSSTEIILLVGKPVWINDTLISHLLEICHCIVEFRLENIQASTVSSHVPGTFNTECSEDRLQAAAGPCFIVVDFLESSIAIGVILAIAIRIIEGECAHHI